MRYLSSQQHSRLLSSQTTIPGPDTVMMIFYVLEMKQELEDSMSDIKRTANRVRAKLKGTLRGQM